MKENFIRKVSMIKYIKYLFILLIVSTASSIVLANEDEQKSVVIEGHSHNDLKRGERFFKGLLPVRSKSPSCVSCHNILPVDTLNWNPSAMEIAMKYASKDFESFEQVVMTPTGKKMSQVHQNFKIESEDLQLVKAYLNEMAHEGYPHEKVNIMWLVGMILLVLVILWALVELIFLRKIKLKIITVVILLGAFTWLINILYHEAADLGRQEAYAPLQPIKFSHKVHAGTNQTDCFYCHSTAEYSKSAGIPSVNVCINCHVIVRDGSNSGRFEIDKIHHAFDNNIPVEWTRVHNLPDHVFFSHAQHVGAGKLDCMECHGVVEEMDILTQHSDLSMGWCLNCHRTKKVQFVENNYYATYKEFHDQIAAGTMDSVTVEQIGGTDCMKCHY